MKEIAWFAISKYKSVCFYVLFNDFKTNIMFIKFSYSLRVSNEFDISRMVKYF